MCHGFEPRDWSDDTEEETDETDGTPSFLSEEPAEDVDILTDGGDE